MRNHAFLKRILFFLLGLLGLISVLCSIAYTSVTNENLYLQGFQQFAKTDHLNVTSRQYSDLAHALNRYLTGKTDEIQVKNPETGKMENAFSDTENLHLKDVRGILTALKIIRYAGGGLVIAVLGALYFLRKDQRPGLLADAARGFALASLALLLIALALLIWGLIDFTGLFWAFHRIVFANDLWLMNPQTDLLVALMPESFFSWYGAELLKSLGPVLGMMLLIPIVWLRLIKSQKETKTT